jgi:hypothetical protein
MGRLRFCVCFGLLVLSVLVNGCGGFKGVVAPTLSGITPSTIAAGSTAFTLTASGTNYVSGTTILWNGASLPTTVASQTQLTAQVSAAQVATPGSVSVRVIKPDNTTSEAMMLTISGGTKGSTFALTTLSPSSVAAGSASFTLTATGAGFVNGAAITVNGSPIATSFDSATQLHATVAATAVAAPGAIAVGVTNADRSTSTTLPLTVTGASIGPPPTLKSITPNTAPSGISTALALTANGTNFVKGSQIMWNGSAMTTNFISSTQLTASIPSSYFATADIGTSTVFVLNPDSTVSGELPFSITISPSTTPVLTSISPTKSKAGDPAFTMTLNGSLFAGGATAYFNKLALQTTVLSSTLALAQVPASVLTSVTEAQVTIQNTQSKLSNPIPYLVGMGIFFSQVNDAVWDGPRNILYITQPSANPSSVVKNPDTVIAIDPISLSVQWTYQAAAGSYPDRLALSNDGKYLYVGLDGAGTVQQLILGNPAGPSRGVTIPLGSDASYGPYWAMDLQASPVDSGTIAVARGVSPVNSSVIALGGVALFDGATRRAASVSWTAQHPYLLDTLQWSVDGSTIYAANNENASGDLYTLDVDQSGVSLKSDTTGVFNNPNLYIHLDSQTGKLYGDDGVVIDPANPLPVSSFQSSGVMVPYPADTKAYFVSQPSTDFGTVTYLLQSFDINSLDAVEELPLYLVSGIPQHIIRWHQALSNQPAVDGLVFTTRREVNCIYSPCSVGDGRMYVIFLPF